MKDKNGQELNVGDVVKYTSQQKETIGIVIELNYKDDYIVIKTKEYVNFGPLSDFNEVTDCRFAWVTTKLTDQEAMLWALENA